MRTNIKILLMLLGIVQPKTVLAQNVQAVFDYVHIGRNFTLTYHHNIDKKWEVYAGPKIFINRPYSHPYHKIHSIDPQELKVFYKTFEARDPLQHLGLKLGVLKKFTLPNDYKGYAFAYYNFMYTSAYQNFNYIIPTNQFHTFPDGYSIEIHEKRNIIKGPIQAFENYVGIGIHYHLKKSIGFKGYAGLGWAHFRYDLIDLVYGTGYGDTHHNDFAVNWGLGIGFDL